MSKFKSVLEELKQFHRTLSSTVDSYKHGFKQDLDSKILATLVINNHIEIVKFEAWAARYLSVIKSLEKFNKDELTETQKLMKAHETLINAVCESSSSHARSENERGVLSSIRLCSNIGESEACVTLLTLSQDIFKQLMEGK